MSDKVFDYFTNSEISKSDCIYLDGQWHSIKGLKEWIKTKKSLINPLTGIKFKDEVPEWLSTLIDNNISNQNKLMEIQSYNSNITSQGISSIEYNNCENDNCNGNYDYEYDYCYDCGKRKKRDYENDNYDGDYNYYSCGKRKEKRDYVYYPSYMDT